jgi:hypothetical protein
MIDTTLPGFDVEAVWKGACEILARIGLEVAGAPLLDRISTALPVRRGRVLFPREVLERYAEEIRQKGRNIPKAAPPDRLTICNSAFCHHYIDSPDQPARPYDTETVIRHTKLTCRLKDEGLIVGGVVGYPLDVPPRLQFLTSYFIDCCYNRSPSAYPLVPDETVLKYMMEIASIMGLRQTIGAEPISPLKFAGASVELAVEHCRDDVDICVDCMPIMGITAPLDWHAAWAQSVAECLGGYVLLRTCGCRAVHPPSFRLFPPNMAAGMIYFSSPQHIFALLSRRKVREFFGLPTDWAELMLITSKAPDQQAAAEKMAGCMLGGLFGFGVIEGAGNLWLDEIFSPGQLMIDVDICNYVRAMRTEFRGARGDLVELVTEGVRRGSFLDTDLTLGCFEDFMWRPALFDLTSRAAWGGVALLDKAARRAEQKLAEYDYELAGQKREQLERVMAEARKELAA